MEVVLVGHPDTEPPDTAGMEGGVQLPVAFSRQYQFHRYAPEPDGCVERTMFSGSVLKHSSAEVMVPGLNGGRIVTALLSPLYVKGFVALILNL